MCLRPFTPPQFRMASRRSDLGSEVGWLTTVLGSVTRLEVGAGAWGGGGSGGAIGGRHEEEEGDVTEADCGLVLDDLGCD